MRNLNSIFSAVSMSRFTWVLMLCLAVFPLPGVTADAQDQRPVMFADSFELYALGNYTEYEEPGLMEEDGFMYGVGAAYTFHSSRNLMLQLGVEYAAGDFDYDGETWAGTPLDEDSDDWMLQIRGLAGYDIWLNDHCLLTPYFGLGYRQWRDNISGAGGYERTHEYWYSPVGLQMKASINNWWNWGFRAEYDFFWGGSSESQLSDVDPALDDIDLDFDFAKGWGARGSLFIETQVTDYAWFFIEPYVRYWYIEESEEGTLNTPVGSFLVVEPKNETWTYGVMAGFRF